MGVHAQKPITRNSSFDIMLTFDNLLLQNDNMNSTTPQRGNHLSSKM